MAGLPSRFVSRMARKLVPPLLRDAFVYPPTGELGATPRAWRRCRFARPWHHGDGPTGRGGNLQRRHAPSRDEHRERWPQLPARARLRGAGQRGYHSPRRRRRQRLRARRLGPPIAEDSSTYIAGFIGFGHAPNRAGIGRSRGGDHRTRVSSCADWIDGVVEGGGPRGTGSSEDGGPHASLVSPIHADEEGRPRRDKKPQLACRRGFGSVYGRRGGRTPLALANLAMKLPPRSCSA